MFYIRNHRDTAYVQFTDDPATPLFFMNHRFSIPFEWDKEAAKLSIEDNSSLGFYGGQSKLQMPYGYCLNADINFEYNYYVKSYERISLYEMDDPRSVENGGTTLYLPSLNMFLLNDAELFNGFPSGMSYNSFERLHDSFPIPEALEYSSTYFKKYGIAWETSGNDVHNSMRDETESSRRIFISKDVQKLLRDDDNKRENYPFFVKVNIDGTPQSTLASIFESMNMDEVFMNFIATGADGTWRTQGYGQPSGGEQHVQYLYPTSNSQFEEDTFTDSSVQILTQTKFLEYLQNGLDADLLSWPAASPTACDALQNLIFGQIFEAKIADYINSHKFQFPSSGAIKQAYCHTETIGWILEKSVITASNDERHCQNYFFFNYEELSDFQLYDTQVMYGKRYIYRIRAVNAVVAPRVMNVDTTYSNAKTRLAEDNIHFHNGAQQYELLYMVEYFFAEEIRILDSPPIAPDVQLITYRGKSDKLLLMFNSMVDKKFEEPVEIIESDANLFSIQRDAQTSVGNVHQSKIIFESDDAPHSFEIFKTTEKPRSWTDFANTSYRIVETSGEYSCAYVDEIVPNTKYYYSFRTRDVHGFISNPTEIYEFEMLKDGETIYPRVRIVDFELPAPPVQKTKTFKKYIKIGVATPQSIVDRAFMEHVTDLDALEGTQINIGDVTTSIWGKDFKFRIKSKNTGKIIDINIAFSTKNVIKV